MNRRSLSLVLGSSGSGKSSVVRTGLIPEWQKSLESQKFYDFIFTPNQASFDLLYLCLLSKGKDFLISGGRMSRNSQEVEDSDKHLCDGVGTQN